MNLTYCLKRINIQHFVSKTKFDNPPLLNFRLHTEVYITLVFRGHEHMHDKNFKSIITTISVIIAIEKLKTILNL